MFHYKVKWKPSNYKRNAKLVKLAVPANKQDIIIIDNDRFMVFEIIHHADSYTELVCDAM